MKISKNSVTPLIKAAHSKVKSEKVEGADLKAYYLDDITVLFTDSKTSFFGITVDVLGRNFHIISDLSVMIEDTDAEDPENNVFVLEDERIIKFLEEFLVIRASLLETFGA